MDTIASRIHALLFAEGGGLTYASLAKSIGCSDLDIKAALDALAIKLEGTGLSLVRSDSEAALAISTDARDIVLKKAADGYTRDIGDAGLEILAILLYEGPSSRADIDYIRGVNSSSTIRNLLMRGLVERTGNPLDGREFIYRLTTDLLAHIGIEKRENAPEYATIAPELALFKQREAVHHEHHGSEQPRGIDHSPGE